jgi:hypothetical protein
MENGTLAVRYYSNSLYYFTVNGQAFLSSQGGLPAELVDSFKLKPLPGPGKIRVITLDEKERHAFVVFFTGVFCMFEKKD